MMDEVLETLQATELWPGWTSMGRLLGETKQKGATVALVGFDQSADQLGGTAGSEWNRLITLGCYSSNITIKVCKAKEVSR